MINHSSTETSVVSHRSRVAPHQVRSWHKLHCELAAPLADNANSGPSPAMLSNTARETSQALAQLQIQPQVCCWVVVDAVYMYCEHVYVHVYV